MHVEISKIASSYHSNTVIFVATDSAICTRDKYYNNCVTQPILQIPTNTNDKLTMLSSIDDWIKFKEVLTRFDVKSDDLIQPGRACLKDVPLSMLDIRSATN